MKKSIIYIIKYLFTLLIFFILINILSCDNQNNNKLQSKNKDSILIDSFIRTKIRLGLPNTRFPGVKDTFFPYKYSIIDTFRIKSLSCSIFFGGVQIEGPMRSGTLFIVLKEDHRNHFALFPFQKDKFLRNINFDSTFNILKRRNNDINNLEEFLNQSNSITTKDSLDVNGLDSLFKIYLALGIGGSTNTARIFQIKTSKELDSVLLANPLQKTFRWKDFSQKDNINNINLLLNYIRPKLSNKNSFFYFDNFFYHYIEVNTDCGNLTVKNCNERVDIKRGHKYYHPIFFSNSLITIDHYSILVNHNIFLNF